MSDLIDFKCVRLQIELDRFNRSNTIPHDLLEGSFSIEDVEECMSKFTPKYKRIATKLIKTYKLNVKKNLSQLKETLRTDYAATIETLSTHSPHFIFPLLLKKYRPNINPVTALYYESRELIRSYDPTSHKDVWLHGLITDIEFNNKILDALSKDMKRLERVISRYYWPLTQLDDNIPLELFHARQMTKDFKHYYTFFTTVRYWDPEE